MTVAPNNSVARRYSYSALPQASLSPNTCPLTILEELKWPVMDVFQSVQGYVTKIITQGESAAAPDGAAKMKILLLDKDTVCDEDPYLPSREG